ncbi:MAG: alpha/beta hydrolase [Psychrilyobacter sp.]|nr:alpha/beta hydrolase [Psychrilyobacter sp.]
MEVLLSNKKTININVEKVGNGEKGIIFLHGGPGATKKSIKKYFVKLEEKFTLLFFDQIACGENEKEYEFDYKIQYELEVIEAIRKKYGFEKISVIGESWGTFLALHYGSNYPQNIEKIILLSSVGKEYSDLVDFGKKLSEKISTEDSETLNELGLKYEKKEILLEEYLNMYLNINSKYYLADQKYYPQVIDTEINFDQNGVVSQLIDKELKIREKSNVLRGLDIYMFQGEQDIITPQDIKEKLEDIIKPNAIYSVEECGHWIFIEKNEYLMKEIVEIIEKH